MKIGIFTGFVLAGALAWHLRGEGAVQTDSITSLRYPFVVVSDPPLADVLLDGRLIGRTDAAGRLVADLDASDVRVGRLTVRRYGYYEEQRAVNPLTGQSGLAVRLSRAPTDLMVESVPAGAEIWVDGALRGISPDTICVLPNDDGILRVLLKRAGYQPHETEMDVASLNGPAELSARLAALPPHLRINSEPTDALVMLNERDLGRTPLSIDLDGSLRGARARLVVSRSKRQSVEQWVDIPADGHPEDVLVSLPPAPTKVIIETIPARARVTLNGRMLGEAPVVAQYPAGEAVPTLDIEGFFPGSHFGRMQLNDVEPSETHRVVVPLELYAQRVVFIVNGSWRSADEFATVREHVKDHIHALGPNQYFVFCVWSEGEPILAPEPRWVAATPEQKIRSYDRLDVISDTGIPLDSVELLRTALSFRPDSVWLYTSAPIDETSWAAIFKDMGSAQPTIQIVTTRPDLATPWLRQWLDEHYGSLVILGGDPAARPPARAAHPSPNVFQTAAPN